MTAKFSPVFSWRRGENQRLEGGGRVVALWRGDLIVAGNYVWPFPAFDTNTTAYSALIQGMYDKAEQLFKRCVTITEKELGPEHPYMTASLGNLAAVLYSQARSDFSFGIL